MGRYDKLVLIQKPRRRWTFWLKRLGNVLLLAAIAFVIRQAWRHHAVTKKLEEVVAEIDRAEPGWRLSEIEAARDKSQRKRTAPASSSQARSSFPGIGRRRSFTNDSLTYRRRSNSPRRIWRD